MARAGVGAGAGMIPCKVLAFSVHAVSFCRKDVVV